MVILQTSILASLYKVKNKNTFVFYSILAQVLGGIGAGANTTASMAILSSFPTDEREKYIGYIEASVGLGFLMGPLLGAMLYSFGGFMLPFAVFGKFSFYF